MKKIYSLVLGLAAICVAGTAQAASTTYKSVALNKTDGTTMLIKLENDAVANVENNDFVLKCSKGQIAVPVSELKNFNFSTSIGSDQSWTTAIDGVESNTDVVVTYTGSEISLTGLAASTVVRLVGMDGRVYKSTVTTCEACTFDLGALVPGVYVVNYGQQSLKIAVR